MRQFFLAIFLAGWAMGPMAFAATPEETAGQALAERLRAAQPEEGSRVTGTLIIRSGDRRKEIPVVCQVTVTDTNWMTTYQAMATSSTGAEQLVVIHSSNGPNQYLYARAPAPSAPLPSLAPVEDASIPLAGSDFSLEDLGLDFLHWPAQRQLKGEMRLGQPCYVLESSRPSGGIGRIRSDIDKESGGILIANAFDGQGHAIKEFSLHGTSFIKVKGQWRLQKMDIRNKKTGSRTELKFDLNK
ncbi:MAG TPA: outer membrane lipoprotein-sorting protein [Candidatus Saccharimonadales bacterium]|nr:outer membrane lipoprotein-sorting protein [Candidatus Saccharimonadales bacterium]